MFGGHTMGACLSPGQVAGRARAEDGMERTWWPISGCLGYETLTWLPLGGA